MFVQPEFHDSKSFLSVPSDLPPAPSSPLARPCELDVMPQTCCPQGLSLVCSPTSFAHGEQAMSSGWSSLERRWITSSISLDWNHMDHELWDLGHSESTKVHCAKSELPRRKDDTEAGPALVSKRKGHKDGRRQSHFF